MNSDRVARIRNFTSVVAGAAIAALAISAPGHATGGGDRVERTGSCSNSSDWKLKAKPDDGRIEVEGEVDSNVNGQVWTWKIKHNGSLSAHGSATTRAPSGSFSITRRLVDLAGADTFVFKATNARTGEACRGRVTL